MSLEIIYCESPKYKERKPRKTAEQAMADTLVRARIFLPETEKNARELLILTSQQAYNAKEAAHAAFIASLNSSPL